MNYESELVRDFASRTRQNLEYIEKQQQLGENVYEVTQLINSLLGLIVFPQQGTLERIPRTPLTDLESQGWPAIEITKGQSECQTLYDLVRYLRNGIAHFNLRFLANRNNQLIGIVIWNRRARDITWEARLTVPQLRRIADLFIHTIQGYG